MATRSFSAPQRPRPDAAPTSPLWKRPPTGPSRHRTVAGPAERLATGWVRRMAVAELADGLAHDLKNQLTVVVVSVQLARRLGGSEREDLLERARQSAMRAARLMDEMLRYTQGAVCSDADADPCEALETAVAGAWGYCGTRGVQLEMHLGTPLPRVRGAGPALRIFFLYLLRWAADRAVADSRLVAEAAAVDGGVRVSLRRFPPEGPADRALREPAEPAGGIRVLRALAREVHASLSLSAATPAAWLPLADGAATGTPGRVAAGDFGRDEYDR